jgi:hypothetical protein
VQSSKHQPVDVRLRASKNEDPKGSMAIFVPLAALAIASSSQLYDAKRLNARARFHTSSTQVPSIFWTNISHAAGAGGRAPCSRNAPLRPDSHRDMVVGSRLEQS